MATTTNYSWTTPDNTAYVKDGASAIRTLGSSVDSTLFTIQGGSAKTGLFYITSATLSGSSVSVTNAFSSTYDAYQLVFSNVIATSGQNTQVRVGAASTGYYQTELVAAATYPTGSGTANYTNNNNAAQWSTGIICGTTTTDTAGGVVNIINPFLTTGTTMQSLGVDARTTGLGTRTVTGYHASATSYTSFTVLCGGGTFSGGTVRVYGYRNS